MKKVNLNNEISKTFVQLFKDAMSFRVQKIIMKGGRSSFKSAVADMILIVGCATKQRSCLAITRTDRASKDKLANNIKKFLRILNLDSRFEYVQDNQRFILLDKYGNRTNAVIRIIGALNVDAVKSMSSEDIDGYAYVFIEEASLFKGKEEIDSLESTFIRGGGDACLILAYNPPLQKSHWLNKLYSDAPCGIDLGYDSAYYYEEKTTSRMIDDVEFNTFSRTLIHHSTYLDAVRDGVALKRIGMNLLAEYEQQREENEKIWKWDKLGIPVTGDSQVFWNIKEWAFDEDFYNKYPIHFKRIGLDVAQGGQDPFRCVDLGYDTNKKVLYIFNEVDIPSRTDNVTRTYQEVADRINKFNTKGTVVFSDGANPHASQLLNEHGIKRLALVGSNLNRGSIKITGASNTMIVKRHDVAGIGHKDFIEAGVAWLRQLNAIYIDRYRCPATYQELCDYSYKVNELKGEVLGDIAEGQADHSIDAIRYACYYDIQEGR